MNIDDLKLCYVDKYGFAWFTTCPLELQWGDDWDDAPYEHNAGDPYDHHYEGEGKDRKSVDHQIFKVAYESDHEPPCGSYTNSPWSVKSINAGNVAWLGVPNWKLDDDKMRPILAGTSLRDFERLIHEAGGEVYYPSGFAR